MSRAKIVSGDMPEEEKKMLEKANLQEEALLKDEAEVIKQKQKVGFGKRLSPYSKPCSLVVIGILVSSI